MGQNSKTQIVTKLKESNCDQTQELNLLEEEKIKTQFVTKLIIKKNRKNSDKTQILTKHKKFNCDKTQKL